MENKDDTDLFVTSGPNKFVIIIDARKKCNNDCFTFVIDEVNYSYEQMLEVSDSEFEQFWQHMLSTTRGDIIMIPIMQNIRLERKLNKLINL